MAETDDKGFRWSGLLWWFWLLASFVLAEIVPGAIPGHPFPQDALWPVLTGGIAVAIAALGCALTQPSPRDFTGKWMEEIVGFGVILFVAHFFFPQTRPFVRHEIGVVATMVERAAPGHGIGEKLEQATRVADLPANEWDTRTFSAKGGEGVALAGIKLSKEAGVGLLEITLRNDTNLQLEGVDARIFKPGDFGMAFSFDVDPALRPQNERVIRTPLNITGESMTANALRAWLTTDQLESVQVQITGAKTQPFDRKAAFRQEVSAWLDE